MQEGLVLSLKFTAFEVELNGNSYIDSVTITDGDGRTLTEETCGGSTYGKLNVGGQGISGTILPDSVISMSNVVSVIFTTNGDYTRAGWQLSWFAVPPHPDIGDYFQQVFQSRGTLSSAQVVTGGHNGEGDGRISSVELFPAPSSNDCSIPDLPDRRAYHSLSVVSRGRLVVCGGALPVYGYQDRCISWVAGDTSWSLLYSLRLP